MISSDVTKVGYDCKFEQIKVNLIKVSYDYMFDQIKVIITYPNSQCSNIIGTIKFVQPQTNSS